MPNGPSFPLRRVVGRGKFLDPLLPRKLDFDARQCNENAKHNCLMFNGAKRQAPTGRMVTTATCREKSGYPADRMFSKGAPGHLLPGRSSLPTTNACGRTKQPAAPAPARRTES